MPLFSRNRKWEGALPAVSQETCLTTHGSMDDGKVHSRILIFGRELFCLPASGWVIFCLTVLAPSSQTRFADIYAAAVKDFII